MDRALPMSVFEKTSAQRNAVTINITSFGQPSEPKEVIDV